MRQKRANIVRSKDVDLIAKLTANFGGFAAFNHLLEIISADAFDCTADALTAAITAIFDGYTLKNLRRQAVENKINKAISRTVLKNTGYLTHA